MAGVIALVCNAICHWRAENKVFARKFLWAEGVYWTRYEVLKVDRMVYPLQQLDSMSLVITLHLKPLKCAICGCQVPTVLAI